MFQFFLMALTPPIAAVMSFMIDPATHMSYLSPAFIANPVVNMPLCLNMYAEQKKKAGEVKPTHPLPALAVNC